MKHHILIVDDDARILDLLDQFFSKYDYIVSVASSVEEGRNFLNYYSFNLVILDVMMPDIVGFKFAIEIKTKYQLPIILLTALNKVNDRITGLESGADDYLSKPFEPKELLLRANKLIQLYVQKDNEQKVILFGNNSYNIETKDFKVNNTQISLTSTEQKLLDLFISNKNQILTRDRLSKEMGNLSPRSIDVQIVRLRAKIESDISKPRYLQSIRNKGYALYI